MERSLLFKPNLENLKRHLREIARERNFKTSPQSLRAVRSYIEKELVSYGYQVFSHLFVHAGQNFSNCIAQLEKESDKPRFIVGAHFDAVPGSPGADDNASGVAALLECARLYAEIIEQISSSIVSRDCFSVEFIAFDLEEYGMIGSRTYVQKLKKDKTAVVGMLSLEMVGFASQEKESQKMPIFLKPFFPNVGNFIGLVANGLSKKFLKSVEKIFSEVENLPVESLVLPANGWIFPDARLSDHSPFWDEGFPALLVTDTSFYRNPHYHSASDQIQTLDLNFLAKVTEAVTRTLLNAYLS